MSKVGINLSEIKETLVKLEKIKDCAELLDCENRKKDMAKANMLIEDININQKILNEVELK